MSSRPATAEDFFAIPEEERFHELIGGELIRKATPSAEHGFAQAGVVTSVRSRHHGPRGPGGPGGWWIATEVEVILASGAIVRPDVLGWRRDSCPERPTGCPVHIRPDWICEVISPSRPNDDTITKLRLYHAVGIPHYWVARAMPPSRSCAGPSRASSRCVPRRARWSRPRPSTRRAVW